MALVKLLLVVIVFAAAVYLLVRLLQERGLPGTSGGSGGSGGLRGRPKKPRPSGPPPVLGPDDDPDFLREIDRKRRLQRDDGDTPSA